MNAQSISAPNGALEEALAVASNADSSPTALFQLADKSVEINRLLAVHKNSTAELLAKIVSYWDENLEGYDVESQRSAIRHPNIAIEDALRIANSFPDDLFMNPAFDAMLFERPDMFDGNVTLLQAKGCPIDVLRSFADRGTRAEQAAVSKNAGLPTDLRDQLNANHFYQHDLRELQALATRQDDEVISRMVQLYADVSRPFCVPRFFPFDRENPKHRAADQLFCGFPYTSAEFPWPIEKLGNYMQPILQINLTNAGFLLGSNLGCGLLQLWGGIDSQAKVELRTRVIPEGALGRDLDWFYPETAPWLEEGCAFDGCAHSGFDVTEFAPFGVENCRVEWCLLGRMFYPSVMTRVFRPQAGDRVEHGLYDREQEFDLVSEQIERELNTACVSRHPSFKGAWGEEPLAFLGGYPEVLGNAWDSYPDNLLFYHSLDYASMMTVGITYRVAKSGAVKFEANWTCDN